MIQYINKEIIKCPVCEEEHESDLVAFPKQIKYNDVVLTAAEFYHSCPIRKEFFQTDRDIIETFKQERVLKKQYDQQIQQQQQWNQVDPNMMGFNPGQWTININGQPFQQ